VSNQLLLHTLFLQCGNYLSLSVTKSGELQINTKWANKLAAKNLPKHVYGFVDLSGGCEEVRIITDARNEVVKVCHTISQSCSAGIYVSDKW